MDPRTARRSKYRARRPRPYGSSSKEKKVEGGEEWNMKFNDERDQLSMLFRAAMEVQGSHSEDGGLSAGGLGDDSGLPAGGVGDDIHMGASMVVVEEDKLADGGKVADGEEGGLTNRTFKVMAEQVKDRATEVGAAEVGAAEVGAVEDNGDKHGKDTHQDLMEHCGNAEEEEGSVMSYGSEFSDLSPDQEMEMMMAFEESLEERELREGTGVEGQLKGSHIPIAVRAIGMVTEDPLPCVGVPVMELPAQLEGAPAQVASSLTQPQAVRKSGEGMASNKVQREMEGSGSRKGISSRPPEGMKFLEKIFFENGDMEKLPSVGWKEMQLLECTESNNLQQKEKMEGKSKEPLVSRKDMSGKGLNFLEGGHLGDNTAGEGLGVDWLVLADKEGLKAGEKDREMEKEIKQGCKAGEKDSEKEKEIKQDLG